MEEYLWSDNPLTYLPDIELNPYTAPLFTKPGINNAKADKAKVAESGGAINAGTFTADALHLSQDVSFLVRLKSLKKAFPDLHLENKPYTQIIAQGDWTATVAMLSGTFKGSLELPAYLGSPSAKPNGKKFGLLHYTICRWKNGKILEMRINADVFGIVGWLGIPLE
ncbi:hypothetical protein BGZ61DRAFT_488089 [Ilyonectria robusta]|uniref:uncharacterized protein n=1 Tax=Ilyonectria robusta TaxID=1079257 RepID=UPI001E8D77D5|nr:uncharacterized protein BGZ61DRAFT_488089 [Ilyonectria robusta]KAH8648242.1 hypothetical protein BGZ61DRAFT_488089 [Ilyonectria robusta]